MNDGIDLSDIAAVTKNNDWGGNGAWWIIVLFLILCGGNWNRNNNSVLDSTLAASAAQGGYVTSNQLSDQLRLQEIQQGQRNITDAVNATEQRLTANQTQALQNQAMYGQQMQTCCSEIKANCDSNYQKIMDKLNQDKIDSLRQQVEELKMQNQMANVVRYPTTTAYTSGANPFCACNCAAV